MICLVGCAAAKAPTGQLQPPLPVALTAVLPSVVLPRSVLVLKGSNFVNSATHVLRLLGNGPQGLVDVQLAAVVVAEDRAEVQTDDAFFNQVGEGKLEATAQVISHSAGGETAGEPLELNLTFSPRLTPALKAVSASVVFLNSKVLLDGDGFLLGGSEGQTLAELKGCFLPEGSSGACDSVGRQVSMQVPVKPAADDGQRRQGYFEFSPAIAGPRPGAMTGSISLVNMHADGRQTSSGSLDVAFKLDKTRTTNLQPSAVSLGQFLEIRGAGFVGAPGSTLIRFQGTFTAKGSSARQVSFELVPAFQDGSWLRYVLEEDLGLGKQVNLRTSSGTLSGTWTPTVIWGTEQVEGVPTTLTVQIDPLKQVVWVRFTDGWSEALQRFGLAVADPLIRQRVFEVFRRDYAGINMEFRDNEPGDFQLYTKEDVSGADPNGLGLLGYDNTPGKDVGNKRLYDWIGGVNALTQQDGYPGYGGIFLESMLGFSKHPPSGVLKSSIADSLFDRIFDPFRPDTGTPVTAAEAIAAPVIDSTESCPATARLDQVACAIRVLGNVVGSTASHELGHSLGLAYPYGDSTDFHDHGDLPNRLMEAGGDRSFAERAEIEGEGPAVFCDEEYQYLKQILPLATSQDPPVSRPSCY